jgi:hypothetical protein
MRILVGVTCLSTELNSARWATQMSVLDQGGRSKVIASDGLLARALSDGTQTRSPAAVIAVEQEGTFDLPYLSPCDAISFTAQPPRSRRSTATRSSCSSETTPQDTVICRQAPTRWSASAFWASGA